MPFYNPQEYGTSLAIYDDGSMLTTNASSLNFVGSGVTATKVGNAVTVTIPGGSGVNFVNSTPFTIGTVDGVNTVFIWANVPVSGMNVFVNGVLQTPSVDYTLSGATVTFFIPPAPGSGIVASYEY